MAGTDPTPPVRFVSIHRNGIPRTIAVLAPPARLEYVRLGALIAPTVEGALGERVIANRLRTCTVHPPALSLRSWRMERRLFSGALRAMSSQHRSLAVADVSACYSSIGPTLARETLEDLGVTQASAVERFLTRLAREGVRGLPVGPDPSAVLANAVLARVDRELEARGIEHVRWVDDFVLGASSPAEAACALDVVGQALSGLGLRLNRTKTRVLGDPSEALGAMSTSLAERALGVG